MIKYRKNACAKAKFERKRLSPYKFHFNEANTTDIDTTPLCVFELKQSSQVTVTSMVQFEARLL